MDTRILKEMIDVIEGEEGRREDKLSDGEDEHGEKYDRWIHGDLPFVNELYLMVLVTIRHQVEKELIRLAARAAADGKDLRREEFQERLKELEQQSMKPRWRTIGQRLKLDLFEEEYKALKALRLLSNCYKHDVYTKPPGDLLKLLGLDTDVNYATLSESTALQEGLAEFIGLKKDAGYSEITRHFVDIAHRYLTDIENQAQLSKVRAGRVSLSARSFER